MEHSPPLKYYIIRDEIPINIHGLNGLSTGKITMVNNGERPTTEKDAKCVQCGEEIKRYYRKVVFMDTVKCYPCYVRKDVEDAYFGVYLLICGMKGFNKHMDIRNHFINILHSIPRTESFVGYKIKDEYKPMLMKLPDLKMPTSNDICVEDESLLWIVNEHKIGYSLHPYTLYKYTSIVGLPPVKSKIRDVCGIYDGMKHIREMIKELP